MMVPPPLSSTATQLSSTFLNNAASSSASPRQSPFILSCRSPVTPRLPWHDEKAQRTRNGGGARRGSSSQLIPPGSSSPMVGTKEGRIDRAFDRLATEDDENGLRLAQAQPSPMRWDSFLPLASPGVIVNHTQRSDGELGLLSTINIIVGKTVGVGAYTVPSTVFAGVGSVGMTLTLWIVGSVISFCGLAVYLDLGTAIPRSGGERVYLERIFRRPHMLVTCMFMAYVVLLGFSTPNAIVLGEYVLYSLDMDPEQNQLAVRAVAVTAVSALCWTHSRHPRFGLHLINILGFAKLLIIVVVAIAGMAGCLLGIGSNGSNSNMSRLHARRLDLHVPVTAEPSTAQRNFSNIWAGSSTQPYDYATALLKVIYCFRGYSTANQVLSDIKNPIRTLRIAAPIALTIVSLAYMAVTVAFFLVVEKDDFKSAGVVVAGVFFGNVFGPAAGLHILPLFVIVSAAGNIATTSFAQARVNEELARDGILPWSGFWARNLSIPGTATTYSPCPSERPIQPTSRDDTASMAPDRGLLLHWAVSVLAILIPSGDIYAFLLDVGGYPVGVISAAASLGLMYLHLSPRERWTSPCRANLACVVIFAVANMLLLVLPWVAPVGSRGDGGNGEGAADFPYYAYPATAIALLGSGAVYWVYWRVLGGGQTPSSVPKRKRRRAWVGTGGSINDGEVMTGLMINQVTKEDGDELLPMDVRQRARCGCKKA